MDNDTRQDITEEMDIQAQWYEDAKKQTPASLTEFMRHVLNDYRHDYGTSVHAVAACAVAAAWAADDVLGISGFQEGGVMWAFIRKWQNMDAPLKLLDYKKMLYPQYEDEFQKTIWQSTAKWLAEEAKTLVDSGEMAYAHPDVAAHWRSVAAGVVPFGYRVTDD